MGFITKMLKLFSRKHPQNNGEEESSLTNNSTSNMPTGSTASEFFSDEEIADNYKRKRDEKLDAFNSGKQQRKKNKEQKLADEKEMSYIREIIKITKQEKLNGQKA